MSSSIRHATICVLAVLVLGLTACSGAGSDNTDGAATPTEAAEAPEASEPTEPSDDLPEAEAGGFDFLAGCREEFDAFLEVQTSYAGSFTGDTVDAEAVSQQLKDLADAAPAEIQAAFEVYATELGPFFEGVAEIGLTGGQPPTQEQVAQLTELGDAVDQDALGQASNEVQAYFSSNCEG